MNTISLKKWLKRLTLITVITTFLIYLWVDYEIDHLWGAHTTVVNPAQFNVSQENIAITNVNILSTDGEQMIANQTVVINQGMITSINSEINLPNITHKIDGKGKYLIPGLIDSHVHLWQSPNDLLLYIANGVTHIRELNGSAEHLKWREEIKQGRLGPHMFVTSSRINSNGVIQGWFQKWAMKITGINAFNNAESVVQKFTDKGYDAIKTYTFISNKDYWELDKATTEIGIPLLGHTPINMELKEVWKSNQKELAHIEELVKALIREFGGYTDKNVAEFLNFVQSRSDNISASLVENKIAVVTTLWLMESFSKQKSHLNKILKEIQLPYANPGITEKSPITSRAMGWLPDSNIYRLSPDLTPEEKVRYLVYWETYASAHHILLKAMVDKGVILLAGTDANVPVTVPGFSLHDELISLTKSGMSNTQTLLSATTVPAQWMKQQSGILKKGYRADLVLLNKNPLENIENTKSIDMVIINGKVLDRQKLDEILAAVKQANDESRGIEISKYQ